MRRAPARVEAASDVSCTALDASCELEDAPSHSQRAASFKLRGRTAIARLAQAAMRRPRTIVQLLLVVIVVFAALVRQRHTATHYISYYLAQRQMERESLLPVPPPRRLLKATQSGRTWQQLLAKLEDPGFPRVLIIDSRNGLANRLRAIASAMGVAAASRLPLLVLWEINAHVNCSFTKLFDVTRLPFALFEVSAPGYERQVLERSVSRYPSTLLTAATSAESNTTAAAAAASNTHVVSFVAYNYMESEGGKKNEWVRAAVDSSLHLYFRSAFVIAHRYGYWRTAGHHLRGLRAALHPEITRRVVRRVPGTQLYGLHVRSVFADAATAVGSSAAFERARAEYGTARATDLLAWRNASHWSNFVPRVRDLISEKGGAVRFFVAADTDESYVGLEKAFPGKILRTERVCDRSDRCDDRGCDGIVTALVDLLSLSRSDALLASGWSSFSEVAAYWGDDEIDRVDRGATPLRREYAGRDFGVVKILSPPPTPPSPPPPPPFKPFDPVPSDACPSREDILNTPSEMRWSLWDDANCTHGCELVHCGPPAPCCVKRQRVSWPVPCSFREFGCYRVGSVWHHRGWVVLDTKRSKVVTAAAVIE